MFDKKYYSNGEFIGDGLKNLPIPQNYGIFNIDDIYEYYGQLEAIFI